MVGTANDNELTDTTDVKNLTIAEAAAALRVSRWKVQELIRTGELSSFRVGSRRLITAAALNEYINKQIAAEAAS